MVASNDFLVRQSEWGKGGRTARAELSRQQALYDTHLVTRFNAGDEAAFSEIVVRHRKRLFSVAFDVLKNRSDAEEVAQDTFIRAHRALADFRGESSLISWLHCIAVNLARNRYWYFYRRARHMSFSLDRPFKEGESGTCADLVATDEAGPARQALTGEFSELVTTCMAQLGDKQQEILNLRVSFGHTYGEIAEKLGISVGTVKSRVARARQILRELLSRTCPEFKRNPALNAWFESVRPGRVPAIGAW
jgi:RNA polymerase sigma-70 factor (ECF subfamily)